MMITSFYPLSSTQSSKKGLQFFVVLCEKAIDFIIRNSFVIYSKGSSCRAWRVIWTRRSPSTRSRSSGTRTRSGATRSIPPKLRRNRHSNCFTHVFNVSSAVDFIIIPLTFYRCLRFSWGGGGVGGGNGFCNVSQLISLTGLTYFKYKNSYLKNVVWSLFHMSMEGIEIAVLMQ